MHTVFGSHYVTNVQSLLTGEKDHQLHEEVTVRFGNQTFEDVVLIGRFINTRKGLQKVSIYVSLDFGPGFSMSAHTQTFTLASLLSQSIKQHVHVQQMEFAVDLTLLSNLPLQFSAFLSSSSSMITSLRINTFGPAKASEGWEQVATAIASMANLLELNLAETVEKEYLQLVLLECALQNKMRLQKLTVTCESSSFPVLVAFLASECASSLNELELRADRFNRFASLYLKAGLMANHSISTLKLALKSDDDDDEEEDVGALEGLPVLFQFLQSDSSIDTIYLRDLGYDGVVTGHLLSALESNTSLENVCLEHLFLGGDDYGSLRRFLLGNPSLQSLELTELEPDDVEIQGFLQCLAEGIRGSRSLRSFRLEQENPDLRQNEDMDLSSVVDALSANQCESLKLAVGAVTASTWLALTNFVQESPLVSLDLQIDSGGQDDILPFIQALKDAADMEHATIRVGEVVNTRDIYADFLGSASSNLKSLSLNLFDDLYDDMEGEEREELTAKVLKCVEANTHLESVRLDPWSHDIQFKLAVKSLCARIKALNAAKGLEDGTMEPAALPDILERIEKDCAVLGESTGVHFVNIWFSLIHSRPLQCQEYCFP